MDKESIIRDVQKLSPNEQARVAAEILNRLGLDRVTSRDFLFALDDEGKNWLCSYAEDWFLD